jgi:probable selenium-dependent hydroxylase accessory protein YqeC
LVSRQKIGISLRQAFGIRPGAVVSLVGGGGKTFLIVEADEEKLFSRLSRALENHNHVTLAAFRLPGAKLKGVSPETVDRLAALGSVPYIINEADGSARKPLKAPNATEPVIPQSTTLVIAIAGADALGCPLTEENVFRPDIVSRLTGLEPGATVTEDTIAVLLTHAEGIAKGTPANAAIVPLINKIDKLPDLSVAESLANKILAKGHPQIKRVVLGQIKRREPIAKIIGE